MFETTERLTGKSEYQFEESGSAGNNSGNNSGNSGSGSEQEQGQDDLESAPSFSDVFASFEKEVATHLYQLGGEEDSNSIFFGPNSAFWADSTFTVGDNNSTRAGYSAGGADTGKHTVHPEDFVHCIRTF